MPFTIFRMMKQHEEHQTSHKFSELVKAQSLQNLLRPGMNRREDNQSAFSIIMEELGSLFKKSEPTFTD
jgi:hypothetical protein